TFVVFGRSLRAWATSSRAKQTQKSSSMVIGNGELMGLPRGSGACLLLVSGMTALASCFWSATGWASSHSFSPYEVSRLRLHQPSALLAPLDLLLRLMSKPLLITWNSVS